MGLLNSFFAIRGSFLLRSQLSRLGVLLLEAVYAAFRIDQLLTPGKERVAAGADFHSDVALMGGAGLELIPHAQITLLLRRRGEFRLSLESFLVLGIMCLDNLGVKQQPIPRITEAPLWNTSAGVLFPLQSL